MARRHFSIVKLTKQKSDVMKVADFEKISDCKKVSGFENV